MIYCYCHMFTGAGRNTGPVNRQTKYKSLKTGVFINTLLFHDSFSKTEDAHAKLCMRVFCFVLYCLKEWSLSKLYLEQHAGERGKVQQETVA